jgi:hypothetical protein
MSVVRIPNTALGLAAAILLLAASAGASIPRGGTYVAPRAEPAAAARGVAVAEPDECASVREAADELRKGSSGLARWIDWGKANAAAASAAAEEEAVFTPTVCPDGSTYPEFAGADVSQFAADISARTVELEPQLALLRAQLAALDSRATTLGCR